MRKSIVFAILLTVLSCGFARAQAPSTCTLTGPVYDATGHAMPNASINFDSVRTQVINGISIGRVVKSINTDINGNLSPNQWTQMLVVSITICDQYGNCGAPFSAIIPNVSTAQFGNMIMGAFITQTIPPSSASGQILGVNSGNTPEWQTLSGGNGNCSFQWVSTGSYKLNCPLLATLASPTFTGTVTMPDSATWTTAGINAATHIGIGAPAGPNSILVTGTANNNTAASEVIQTTSTGTAAQALLFVQNSTSQGAFSMLGTGFTTSGSQLADSLWVSSSGTNGMELNTNTSTAPISFWINNIKQGNFNATGLHLTSPLEIVSGGTGNATAPTATQILIAQSATAYTPQTVNGDGTLTTAGLLTVTKLGGQTPGGTCTAGQFVTQIDPHGIPICALPTGGSGYPNGNPPMIAGYALSNTSEAETVSGGVGNCTFSRTGANAYQLSCPGYAPLASPTFSGTVTIPTLSVTGTGTLGTGSVTGNLSVGGNLSVTGTSTFTGLMTTGSLTLGSGKTLTFPDGSTWTNSGSNVVAASTVTLNNSATAAMMLASGSLNSAGGNVQLGAGAHNTATGWMADQTAATILSLSGATGGSAAGIFINNSLTVGTTFSPTQIAVYNSAGEQFLGSTGIGVGTAPASSLALVAKWGGAGTPTTTNASLQNTLTTGASTYYVNDDAATPHYGAFTIYNTAWAHNPCCSDFADSLRILTNATAGMNLDSNNAPIGFWAQGYKQWTMRNGGGTSQATRSGLEGSGNTDGSNRAPGVTSCHEEFGLAAGASLAILTTGSGEWNVTSSGLLTVEVWDDTNANSYAKKVCTYAVDFDAGGNEWVGGTTFSQLHCGAFNPAPPFTITGVAGPGGSPALQIQANNTATYHEIWVVDYLSIHGGWGRCTTPAP